MSADAESETTADGDSRDFPNAPRRFTDEEGRVLRFRSAGDSVADLANESAVEPADDPASDSTLDGRDSLAAMYDTFGVADRAQGIPPANPRRRDDWLDRLAEGIEVLGWHGERAVAHGILLDGGSGHELALFVHPDYRRAGVGSALVRTLLGRGRAAGVERVWLSVERTNHPAVRLYRGVGFEPTASGAGEIEMSRSL